MARHVYRCPLRWSDMDAYGHVNNSVFLTLLEEARVDLLLNAAGKHGVAMLDTGVLVKRHEIEYLAPLAHRVEPVTIEVWTHEYRSAAFTVSYEVKDDQLVYAKACTTLVAFDLAAGRVRRLTDGERAFLEAFADSPR